MKTSLYKILAAIGLCASCSPMEEIRDSQPSNEAELSICVNAEQDKTKAMITSERLPDGSQIGIIIMTPDGDDYGQGYYKHLCYKAQSNDGGQVWTTRTAVNLTDEEAVVYSYYPYTQYSEPPTDLTVQANSNNQEDWMYGTPCRGLNADNRHANITMHHALAGVRITTSRGSYEGEGRISSLGVGGDAIATKAKFNALTGKFTSYTSIGGTIYPTKQFSLADGTNTQDLMVIPNPDGEELVIKMRIDDIEYSLSMKDIELEQGKITHISIRIDRGQISIASVTVNDWYVYDKGTVSAPADYKVNIAGNTEGMSFETKIADNGDVTIVALTHVSKDGEPRPVTIEGDATLTQTVDTDTGVRTITISDIQSNVSVVFNGYYLWSRARFEVSDITKAQKVVKMTQFLEAMRIDGKDVEIGEDFMFDTPGLHEVMITSKNQTEIYDITWYNITSLRWVKIAEGITSLRSRVFQGCTGVETIILPKSIKTIGYQCFERCSKLTSPMIIADGVTLGYGLFSQCSSLTEVRFPETMTEFPSYMIRSCKSLKSVTLPKGITKIGYSALSGLGVESLHIPDGVTELDDEVFYGCQNLKEINIPASLTKIGRQAYYFLPALERIIMPDGTVYTDEFIIPEGVTYLGRQAVETRSEAIKTIRIPSTLAGMDSGGLAGQFVENYRMPIANPVYDIRNNAVIETASNTLVAGCIGSTKIHESVTGIAQHAYHSSHVPSVDIPASVTWIGQQAFVSAHMTEIISRAAVPPTIDTETFWISEYNGVAKVPAESIDLYKEQWWKTDTGYLGWKNYKWKLQALEEGE